MHHLPHVPTVGKEKRVCTRKFVTLHDILSDINEPGTSFFSL